MATIETLRVEYASRIAAQAKADQDALIAMAKAMETVGTKTQATDEVLKRASQTYDRVVTKIDGVAAATNKLEAAERTHASQVAVVSDKYRSGNLSLEQAQKEIAKLNVLYDQATQRAIAHGNAVEQRFQQAGTAVNTALTSAGTTTQKFTGQTDKASYAVRQLGIQSIDVFQQLASGAPIMTTFIQQGGQIGQVMAVSNTSIGSVAKSIGAMIAANAGVIGVTAGMVGLGVATYAVFQRASDLESQQRTLGVAIAGVGRSAELSTGQLQGYVAQLKQQGVSAAEAQAAVVALTRNSSLSGGAIARIVGLAPNAAAASGQSIQDVTRLMADAMKGTVDGVQKLDEAFNLLTAAEAASIRVMIEHGNTARALDDVFSKFGSRVAGLNDDSLSPMEKAFRDMGNAWDGFMTKVLNSGPVVAVMSQLAKDVRAISGALFGATGAELSQEIVGIDRKIAELRDDKAYDPNPAMKAAREAEIAKLLARQGTLIGQARAEVPLPTSNAALPLSGGGSVGSMAAPDAARSLASLAATRAGASDQGKIKSLTIETDKFRAALKDLDPAVEGNKALVTDYTRAIAANEKSIADLNKKNETHRTGLEKLADTYDVQIAAAQRLTAAYGVSRTEVTRVTAVREAEEKAVSNGLTPGTRKYREEVEKTTGRILELRRAQGEGKMAEQIRDVEEATEAQLRINAAYDGTAESLERVTAQEKAHAAALKSGIEPGMTEYEATVGKLFDSYIRGTRAAEDFRHIQSSVQAVTDILSTAFDRLGQGIVDAFLSGKGAAVSFSSIVRSVLASAATSLVQLGAVNPLLNLAGGRQRDSLWTGLTTLTGGGGGISGQASGGLNIMNAGSNVSTFGGITDALGLTDFAGKLSGIGEYLGITGSNGLFGGVGSGISSLLATGINGVGVGAATNTALAGLGAGVYGPAAPASVLAAQGGATIGGMLSGVGLGFGAGSMAGGVLQSSLGKVGPAPSIGAGLGSIAGVAATLIPGVGAIIGPLLAGLLGGGAGGLLGGLIGPKAATPFSATGLTANNGMLGVGQTFSQIVDTTAEVQALQQQTAQINAILAQSNLRIANGFSADEFGQSRIIGGNTGQWLNFGQGNGRPGSIADAFGDLRFSASGNDPLNSYLSGRSFGNLEDLQAQVQRITQFVDVTVPALIALGETTKTFGDGSLSANLAALNRQYDDAIATARELGHEENALANARNNAIAATSKAARDLFDQTGMSADIRYFQAQAINDNNPRLAFDANLTAFDIRAKSQRDALSDQLLAILGDAGRTSAEYLDLMAREDRATYAERLSLLTQYNAQAVSADRTRGEQSALATVTRLSEYSNSLTFSDASPLSAQDKYSAAISNFRAVSEGIGQSDFNSLSRLPDVANDLLGASRGLFGSGAQYAADFATVQTVLRGAASQSPENIVAQAIQATEAQQTAVLGSLLEQMIGRLDLLLTETRFQAMKAAA
jgi:hypothetical protein